MTKKELKEYKRQWYLKNKKEILQLRKEYYLKNREDILGRCSEYYSKNKERTIVRSTKWNRDHRGRHNAITRKHKRKRQKMMPELFAWAGNVCSTCESSDGLLFHHTNPSTKEFGIGDNTSNSLVRIWNELDKCVAICRSCHIKIHKGDLLNGRGK